MAVLSWEQATWPIKKGVEISSDHFEDIRKRLFLIKNYPAPGYTNWEQDHVFTHANWGVNNSPHTRHTGIGGDVCNPSGEYLEPGLLAVWFENPVTHVIRKYANYAWAYADFLDPDWFIDKTWNITWGTTPSHPDEFEAFNIYAEAGSTWLNCPININGTENPFWREIPNPNLYAHWNYNSNKWVMYHNSGIGPVSYSSYDTKLPAHQFLPRQTEPWSQKPPFTGKDTGIKEDACGCTKQYSPVEFRRAFLTQALYGQTVGSSTDGNWSRCLDSTYYPSTPSQGQGCWPLQYSMFGPHVGHPFDIRIASLGMPMHYWSKQLGALQSQFSGGDVIAAYQDFAMHTIDSYGFHRYVWPVTQAYKDKWAEVWKEFFDEGPWSDSMGFLARGKVVQHNSEDYIVLTQHTAAADKEPGTAGGADYFALGIWQPDWFGEMSDYKKMGHDFWECNASAFELVLEMMGLYDWWWDDSTPPMYNDKISAWSMSPYEARWDMLVDWAGGGEYHPEWWPKPVGCWRKTWRYAMRDIPNKIMWPKELGDPREFLNLDKGKMLVSQSTYDQVRSGYEHFYQVVDVPYMLNQVRLELDKTISEQSTTTYRDLVERRHGETQTEHVYTQGGVYQGYVHEYEVLADMVNDIRDALEFLKYMRINDLVDVDQWGIASAVYGVDGPYGVRFDDRIECIQWQAWKCENDPNTQLVRAQSNPPSSILFIPNGFYVGYGYWAGEFGPFISSDVPHYGFDETPLMSKGIYIVGDKEGGTFSSDGDEGGYRKFDTGSIGSSWKVGDFVTLSKSRASTNVHWTTIREIRDEDADGTPDHIVLNIAYDAGEHVGDWTLNRWTSWTRGTDKVKLRLTYATPSTSLGREEPCTIGILGETLRGDDEIAKEKFGFLTCEKEPGDEPSIFEISLLSPWPAHSPDDSLYHYFTYSYFHHASRVTGTTFEDTNREFVPWVYDDHIIAEINWEKYVEEAEFEIFGMDCENVVDYVEEA